MTRPKLTTVHPPRREQLLVELEIAPIGALKRGVSGKTLPFHLLSRTKRKSGVYNRKKSPDFLDGGAGR